MDSSSNSAVPSSGSGSVRVRAVLETENKENLPDGQRCVSDDSSGESWIGVEVKDNYKSIKKREAEFAKMQAAVLQIAQKQSETAARIGQLEVEDRRKTNSISYLEEGISRLKEENQDRCNQLQDRCDQLQDDATVAQNRADECEKNINVLMEERDRARDDNRLLSQRIEDLELDHDHIQHLQHGFQVAYCSQCSNTDENVFVLKDVFCHPCGHLGCTRCIRESAGCCPCGRFVREHRRITHTTSHNPVIQELVRRKKLSRWKSEAELLSLDLVALRGPE